MIPKTLSASSLHVAELCMDRWESEQFNRTPSISNMAALGGTALHGALEMYVKYAIQEGSREAVLKTLLDFYKISFMKTFGTMDIASDDYKEGVKMLTDWFKRTDFNTFTVVSTEVKEQFMIPTSAGDIPFNFIFDRHDDLGNNMFRIVDYKSNRAPLTVAELRQKLQARCYGLAGQIKHPDADKIWVEFDMLRHGGIVGTAFSKADNIATWNYIKVLAERIIATPEGQARATLNTECLFCVKKGTCGQLTRNIRGGGVFANGTALELVDKRAALDYQKKAIEAAIKEIDTVVMAEMRETDQVEFESDMYTMSLKQGSKREAQAERIQHIVGPDLWSKYGDASITLANVDKLKKSGELTDDQIAQIDSCISKSFFKPSISVKAKDTFTA